MGRVRWLAILVVCLTTVGVRTDEFALSLRAFLIAHSAKERAEERKALLATAGLTAAKLEAALQAADLWSGNEKPVSPLKLELGAGPVQAVHFELPKGYTPKKRWPLLIVFHGQGSNAAQMLAFTHQTMGTLVKNFILVAPQDIDGPGFSQPADLEMRPRQIVIALRKVFRLDSDHIFVAGYSLGGQRTWLTAVEHPDLFAGALPMAATLIVPGGDVLYAPLLENTRHLPVLCVWGELDGPQPVPDRGDVGIVGGDRRIMKVASALDLPKFVGLEMAGVGHMGAIPPHKELESWLKQKREHWPRAVSQSFRLAETSGAYWVRVQKLGGAPLPAGEIRAPVKAGQDPQMVLAAFIRKQMGSVEASVKGQVIELRTKRSTFVDVMLHDDLIDMSKPIVIKRNGSKVFEGVVEPDLGVMLDEAAATWDFQRVPRARLVVPAGGKVKMPGKRKAK